MEHLNVVGLLKATQILERNMTVALMYSGLRIPQYRLLDALAGAGRATVTEMSDRLHVTRATASVMINDLIKSGIIAVAENPSDRRSFHIQLTDIGKNKLRVARNDLAVFENKLSSRLSPQAIRALNEFTETMSPKANQGHAVDTARKAIEVGT